jgi:hypothetical protein
MLAAVQMLQRACHNADGLSAALGNTAAVAALASALGSISKRAAVLIGAAAAAGAADTAAAAAAGATDAAAAAAQDEAGSSEALLQACRSDGEAASRPLVRNTEQVVALTAQCFPAAAPALAAYACNIATIIKEASTSWQAGPQQQACSAEHCSAGSSSSSSGTVGSSSSRASGVLLAVLVARSLVVLADAMEAAAAASNCTVDELYAR